MTGDVRKTALVPYAAERMFDLIEAAEHYPEFLPWCAGAVIVERTESVVAADITVDYHGVRFGFSTRNPKRRPHWMAVTLSRGPFRHFEGEWMLAALAQDACRIDFDLRYDFGRNPIARLATPVFDRIANTLVDAFVLRADRMFGAGPPPATPSAPSQGTQAS